MARAINANDPYLTKLLKTIPSEIVGAYLFLCGVIGASGTTKANPEYAPLMIAIFFVLLLLTPLYLWKIEHVKVPLHLLVSTISFAVWVYTLGGTNGPRGPFPQTGPSGSGGIFLIYGLYSPAIAATILVLWTMVSPFIVPPDPAEPA